MSYDVVVVGEILVELASDVPLADGVPLSLGVSGDVVNAASAAAAAGARTALLARIADDELGDVIEERLVGLGIDTALVRRVPGQQGAYLVHADPLGGREFVYLRRGSAGATLSRSDVAEAGLETVGAVLTTGVTAALSESARAAVLEVAHRASCLVYDPNYRPRLTTAEDAAGVLRAVAPHARVVTPAAPGETSALLGTEDPERAARILLGLGARAAVVTRGAEGALVADASGMRAVPAVPAPRLVDQTGAGDSLAGTLTARLVLGDSLEEAVRLGTAAASLVLGGRGGTGYVPSLSELRAHLKGAVGDAEENEGDTCITKK
jgi:2-dehydro-3-deoxygluconokinase